MFLSALCFYLANSGLIEKGKCVCVGPVLLAGWQAGCCLPRLGDFIIGEGERPDCWEAQAVNQAHLGYFYYSTDSDTRHP